MVSYGVRAPLIETGTKNDKTSTNSFPGIEYIFMSVI